MQHDLNWLEAQGEGQGCRERRRNLQPSTLSSQNMLFGIGLGIRVCLLASILFWRGGRARSAVNGLSKWQEHYSPELYREPWYC
jgi:hypothetical protein